MANTDDKFSVDPGQPPQAPQMSTEPPTLQQTLIAAVEAHFVAQRARATANINTYIMNSVGVGEHSDVVGEVIKLVESIDNAESILQTLQRITSK